MPVVKKDVESLFVEVARAAIGNNHVYPTFQKSQRGADGKDIFIYPAVVYYVTGSESVQTLKNQKEFLKDRALRDPGGNIRRDGGSRPRYSPEARRREPALFPVREYLTTRATRIHWPVRAEGFSVDSERWR